MVHFSLEMLSWHATGWEGAYQLIFIPAKEYRKPTGLSETYRQREGELNRQEEYRYENTIGVQDLVVSDVVWINRPLFPLGCLAMDVYSLLLKMI